LKFWKFGTSMYPFIYYIQAALTLSKVCLAILTCPDNRSQIVGLIVL
jgi:hypothetical protein